MPLHRLTIPAYFGGLPSTHDEVNNATSGTPAPAAGVSVDATYSGTYFIVPAEFATANNINRAAFALAENTDFIDDILYTSRPIPSFEAFTAGAADTQQALTGDVFVGRSGIAVTQEVRNSLIQVVEAATLEPIVQAVSGAAIFVNDIRDSGDSGNVIGTEASGYHTGPIAVFSSALPSGISYRLLHLNRGTVAEESDPTDATGDMGYMAQLIIEAARNQEAAATPFRPLSSNWADASGLTDTTTQAAIDQVVDTLGSSSAANDGALHIGAEAHTPAGSGLINLLVGSIRSQLDRLSDLAARHDANQIVAGNWDITGDLTLSALVTRGVSAQCPKRLAHIAPTTLDLTVRPDGGRVDIIACDNSGLTANRQILVTVSANTVDGETLRIYWPVTSLHVSFTVDVISQGGGTGSVYSPPLSGSVTGEQPYCDLVFDATLNGTNPNGEWTLTADGGAI